MLTRYISFFRRPHGRAQISPVIESAGTESSDHLPVVTTPASVPLSSSSHFTTPNMTSGRCQRLNCLCESGSFRASPGPVADINCLRCTHPFNIHLMRAASSVSFEPLLLPTWCPRAIVVSRLYDRVLENRIVLIRGTPASGKTILMHLLHRHFLDKNPTFKVFTFAGWPAGLRNNETFQYLESSLGATMKDIFAAQDLVILIDDAQSSYYDDALWGFLKLMEPAFGAYFVLFSAYGSPGPYPVEMKSGTPPILKSRQRVTLNWETTGESPLGLLLTPEEGSDVISRACKNNADRPIMSADLSQLLFRISGGHAGALSGLVDTVVTNTEIKHARLIGGGVIDIATFELIFFEHPTAARLRMQLSSQRFGRGLPRRNDMHDRNVAHVLKEIARKEVLSTSLFEEVFQGTDFEKYKDALNHCYYKGWVHKTLYEDGSEEDEAYTFPSPLHLWNCRALLLPENPITTPTHRSPIDMAIDILKRFKPSKLSDPPRGPSQASDSPPEAQYGIEWYRCSDELLDGNILWAPEYGDRGKGGGAIDFYLANFKWGFEFTREGSELRRHYKRFLPGGNYHRWIQSGCLTDFLLLDFRSNKPTVGHIDMENLYHICFSEEFTFVEVIDRRLKIIQEFHLAEE